MTMAEIVYLMQSTISMTAMVWAIILLRKLQGAVKEMRADVNYLLDVVEKEREAYSDLDEEEEQEEFEE